MSLQISKLIPLFLISTLVLSSCSTTSDTSDASVSSNKDCIVRPIKLKPLSQETLDIKRFYALE